MILFLCFNIADLAGKLMPLFNWAPSQLLLLILCAARVAFFPAFFCAAKFAAPPYVTAALTFLLGISNGWAASWVAQGEVALVWGVLGVGPRGGRDGLPPAACAR